MDNPAHSAAKAVEGTLNKITLPTVETFEPEALSAAATAYAILVRKLQAAQRAIEQLKADQWARELRLDALRAILAHRDGEVIDIWCCRYIEHLTGTVKTMEVPGYQITEGRPTVATLKKDTSEEFSVAVQERSLNIVPTADPAGDLCFAEGMGDAAIAYNLAMEPGHLKWRPAFRYGILVSVGGGVVHLHDHRARKEQDDQGVMSIDQAEVLTGVPIEYPPCGASAFEDGDEVLVVFRGQQQQSPVIVGFRRSPKECGASWRQIR